MVQKIEVRLDFERFPPLYTCDGADVSPRVNVTGGRGICMAVIVEDPDAPSGTFTHWVMWNIMPVNTIPERVPKTPIVTAPINAVQGKNTAMKIGYMGPCPPGHAPHRYIFKVFVLDDMIDLPAGSSKHDLEKAMEGIVLQSGEAVATYAR